MNSDPKSNIICPGCSQGRVLCARVRALDEGIYVCDECETMWFQKDDIGSRKPCNFVNFMRGRGLEGLWSELEVVAE
jgi:hypothetical protein